METSTVLHTTPGKHSGGNEIILSECAKCWLSEPKVICLLSSWEANKKKQETANFHFWWCGDEGSLQQQLSEVKMLPIVKTSRNYFGPHHILQLFWGWVPLRCRNYWSWALFKLKSNEIAQDLGINVYFCFKCCCYNIVMMRIRCIRLIFFLSLGEFLLQFPIHSLTCGLTPTVKISLVELPCPHAEKRQDVKQRLGPLKVKCLCNDLIFTT